MSDGYPDSKDADKYKLLTLKSYYKFAENSFVEKQKERFDKVIEEYNDFVDRFSDSPLMPEAKKIKTQISCGQDEIVKSLSYIFRRFAGNR